ENFNDFYDGSRFFSFLTTVSGLPIDQVNFLVCQFFILVVAYFFRTQLNVERVGPRVRHITECVIGFTLLYFCFGRGLMHVVLQTFICWVVMKVFKYGPMEKIVLGSAVSYLCITHIYRMIYDYGGFTLDITGPLMLSTQRLSSLAFGLADAEKLKKDVKMVDNLKSKVVHKFPSVLEFLSFMFTFHGVMCGPVCFYSDYIKFIEGTDYDSKAQLKQQNGNNHLPTRPSPMPVIRRKLLLAGLFGASTIILLPLVPISLVTSPEYATYNFFYKVFLIVLFTALQRQKYYFAWKLGEASNLNAGLGYNGVDEHGNSRWDLIANVDVLKVEFSTSLKVLIDNWNISTACWLRYIIYDRLHSIVPVFLFSALWHGFYPGYYITFITGGLFISTARLMRKVVRPHFQTSPTLKFIYDVVTFLASRLAVSYLGLPFLVLEFW
ncbi:hypothetical protein HELRODRAFT_120427, partial [Helobdella robusta]|uniref:Uncharacterized protein n=1 Tax=Helobdella robusta TaxID=6412 RepID=T1EGP9_HELRO